MTEAGTAPPQSGASEIHMEVRIAGSPEAVWKALTEEIGAWWPEAFYAGGEAGRRSCTLDATPGGRMLESWEGGGGLLWGTVCTVDPGRRLQVLGTTFPDWGGPSHWFGTWELEADGAATLLRFSESTLGVGAEKQAAEKDKGWRFLFEGALKAHVEGTPAPEWKG